MLNKFLRYAESCIDELFPALYHIGVRKKSLPDELKGWVNVLGLYVQNYLEFPGLGCRECLAAGGKYKRYFYATCEFTMDSDKDNEISVSTLFGDFSHWQIKKFEHDVWDKRFAHLVVPTCEIAFYISDEAEKDPSLSRLSDITNCFKSTGEWPGLHNHQCASCSHPVIWWDYYNCKPCPFCGGKIRD